MKRQGAPIKTSSPRLGFWTLVFLVVGNAVGAGIYTTSGFALDDLGSREWVMLAWFIAGLIALCGALSYGMLSRGITESGGEYLFISRSIHPLAGFIAGWISLLAGFPGAIAFAATALEAYAQAAFPQLHTIPADSLAISAVLFAGLIHYFRVDLGALAHDWIVLMMLILLALVLVFALGSYATDASLPVPDHGPVVEFSMLAFANALVWISLSYSGFNAPAYIAEEVEDARNQIPKAMIVGTLITMVLCMLVNMVLIYAAEPSELRGQAEIAALAAEAIAGKPGRRVIECVIALSLMTSITAMVMAGPRVYAKMAADGALPKLFRQQGDAPPRAAILLQVAIAIFLILLTDLRALLSYLGLTLSLCLALAVSSLFVRHWRLAERPDSVFYPWAPLLFVSATVCFATLTAVRDSQQLLAIIPTIVIGSLAYLYSRRSEVV